MRLTQQVPLAHPIGCHLFTVKADPCRKLSIPI